MAWKKFCDADDLERANFQQKIDNSEKKYKMLMLTIESVSFDYTTDKLSFLNGNCK